MKKNERNGEELFKKQCEKKSITERDVRRFKSTCDTFSAYNRLPTAREIKNYTGLSGTQIEFLSKTLKLKIKMA